MYEGVEPARTQQCGINEIGTVGSGDNEDGGKRLDTIHLVEKLRENTRANTTAASSTTTAFRGRCAATVASRPPTHQSVKKIIAGAAARARLKSAATARSDSPTHFEKSSGPLTARKLVRDSAARALAANVFEQPGGP